MFAEFEDEVGVGEEGAEDVEGGEGGFGGGCGGGGGEVEAGRAGEGGEEPGWRARWGEGLSAEVDVRFGGGEAEGWGGGRWVGGLGGEFRAGGLVWLVFFVAVGDYCGLGVG